MSLFRIAWRNIEQRALASALTAFSMALGVALVAAVIVIYAVIDTSFQRSAQGYDLIVGGKGDPLTLVLDTVFHIGNRRMPTVPYAYYDEFTRGHYAAAVKAAVPICTGHDYKGYAAVATVPAFFEDLTYHEGKKYAFAAGRNFRAENLYEAVIGATVARNAGVKLGDKIRPTAGGADEHEDTGFEVVGILAPTSTPNDRAVFLNLEGFYACPAHQQAPTAVARLLGAGNMEAPADMKRGAAPEAKEIHPPAGKEDQKATSVADRDLASHERAGEHAQEPPASTMPGDHGSTAEVHDHDAAHAEDAHDHAEAGDDHDHEHDHDHARVLTAILVRTDASRPRLQMQLSEVIDKQPTAMAVAPVREIERLFRGVIGNIQLLLLILAVLVVIVAGIGILVSIYNSMNERRHDIAIMRALGAGRSTVMAVILVESILLSLGGGIVGVLLAHGLVAALGPYITEQTGVIVNALQFQAAELWLIPGLIALATAVGFLPAMSAYKTDVSKALQSGA